MPVYLAAVLVYLLLLPEQLHPSLADFYLPAHRLFLIPATLYLMSTAMSGRMRFAWPDLLIVLAAAWIWLASFVQSGSVMIMLNQGGSHTVEIALAYFLARVAIQSPRELRLFLVLIAPGLGIASLIVFQEAVTHIRVLQPLAAELTGIPNRLRDDTRLGFMRGAGPFPHPIHAGMFLASFLPLYWASGLKGWPRMVGLAASLGGFFSMSSAALLGLIMGTVFSVYDWITERVANLTWRLFLAGSVAFYFVVELTSNSGFYTLLIRYASLNTATAYNRVHIWNFGMENVMRYPWFGLGYDDWIRPAWMHSGSFDHFWLLMALRFGIPSSILLILATVAAVALLAMRSSHHPAADGRAMRGLAISLAVFAFAAASASLWLSALVWFSMMVGMAVSLGVTPAPRTPLPAAYNRPPPGQPVRVQRAKLAQHRRRG